jgi:hypothetical protein
VTEEEYHEQELSVLKELFDASMWPGLFDAVRYCHTFKMPLPEWASLAVLKLIQDRHYQDGVAGGYGKASGKLRMDYAHYLRHNAVKAALLSEGLNRDNPHPLPEVPEGRRGRPAKGKRTKKAVLEAAAKLLEGNPLARYRKHEQLEESYRMVEASLAAGEARFRFDRLYTL